MAVAKTRGGSEFVAISPPLDFNLSHLIQHSLQGALVENRGNHTRISNTDQACERVMEVLSEADQTVLTISELAPDSLSLQVLTSL